MAKKPKGRPLRCISCPAGASRVAYMPGPYCATHRKEAREREAAAAIEERMKQIRLDAKQPPGYWASISDRGPACTCGLIPKHLIANAVQHGHGVKPLFTCQRHPEGHPDGR